MGMVLCKGRLAGRLSGPACGGGVESTRLAPAAQLRVGRTRGTRNG